MGWVEHEHRNTRTTTWQKHGHTTQGTFEVKPILKEFGCLSHFWYGFTALTWYYPAPRTHLVTPAIPELGWTSTVPPEGQGAVTSVVFRDTAAPSAVRMTVS